MIFLVKLLIFLATCKHYDGIIWPEIFDKTAASDSANVGLRAKAMNVVYGLFGYKKENTSIPSSEQAIIDIKTLSLSNHIQARINALKIYLSSLHNILHGVKSVNDPIDVIRTVYAIYKSLDDSCVYFDEKEIYWRFKEIAQVSIESLNSGYYWIFCICTFTV